MGLTRIRAEQISDIDYKQAVRVITVTNVTLNGGAPNSVDNVNLNAGDRVLVTAQSPGSQNGIYVVSTLGTGSNGTWVRSIDGNETGEIEAGMIIMVTEGDVYKDTQWKLTTNNPIVIGTTPLTFEQNSAFAFGNIYANGTAVLANSVGSTVTLTPGDNISITGNNSSKTVTIGVTGISLNSIANGTSNVTVVSSGGNVTVGVGGTNNVAVFSSSGQNVTGYLTTSGNITGGNLNTAGQVVANGNLTGNNLSVTTYANVGTINSAQGANITGTLVATSSNAQFFNQTNGAGYVDVAGYLTVVGNITGGNLISSAAVTTTGNITGGNILGNGAGLSGINVFSNVTVSGGNSCLADSISDTLTLAAGSGIVLVADSSTDTITISAGGTGTSIFATGGDMELITDVVTDSLDLGLVTEAVTENNDLGGFFIEGFVGNDNFLPNTIYGNILQTNAVITTTGNVTVGNLISNGQVIASYAPASTVGVGITVSGANTQGGAGYADFLRATNSSGGATNSNKTFRLNSTGGLEIINSAYDGVILSLTNAGELSVTGPISVAGKQAVNGPAFSAYPSSGTAQTLTSGSQQKILFGSEEYDTNNNFASSTFTPTVEGYYQLNAAIRLDGGGPGTGECMIVIYKNGAEHRRSWNQSGTAFANDFWMMSISSLVYANGTGDYFEIYAQQSSGAARTVQNAGSGTISWFNGSMMRGA
jgi:hypothetical protein